MALVLGGNSWRMTCPKHEWGRELLEGPMQHAKILWGMNTCVTVGGGIS